VTAPVWTLDVELPDWLGIPASPDDAAAWRSDVAEIFAAITEVDAGLAGTEGAPPAAGPLDVPSTLDTLLEFAAALPEGQRLVAGLGVAGRWPLPVVVRVWASGDTDDDLLDAAGARGGMPVDQPTVEYLPEELGDGIRVTRFDLDDDGAVWASVGCARRADGVDSVVHWRTTELELLPLFSPQLEELIGLITVHTTAEAGA
jgi:hypothetical protein